MEQFEKGLVSIIIPVFNRETLLPETLDSILDQTYDQWECIIVDDGSTDTSLEVARTYASKDSRFKVHQRPWHRKKGANTCRNYGLELSRGEFIHWFDSDDKMDFNTIKFGVNCLQDPEYQMGIFNATYFNDKTYEISSKNGFSSQTIGNNPAFEYFSTIYFFQTSQVFFRHQSLLNSKKKFNVQLRRNQETHFFIELILLGFKMIAIDNACVYIRNHQNSISGKYLALDYSEKYLMDFEAYKKIYISFKESKYFTTEVQKHFSQYFFKSLLKAKPNTFIYIKIFLFGVVEKIFPSFILAIKVFLFRMFKNV